MQVVQTLSVVIPRFYAHRFPDGSGAHHRLEPYKRPLPYPADVGIYSAIRCTHSPKASLERTCDAGALDRLLLPRNINLAYQ